MLMEPIPVSARLKSFWANKTIGVASDFLI